MNVLNRICAEKREHIRVMRAQTPLSTLKEMALQQDEPRGFKARILDFAGRNRPALIAEIKKASPSKGVIRQDFDPVEIARIYQASGAACLSILTDAPYFQGDDSYLGLVREAVDIPLLRKDFMIDLYQIYESRALGADCILLIMAALTDSQAEELYETARLLGMDVLVEIHDAGELERALKFSPGMVGINNRNLKTLEVDIQTAHTLAGKMPADLIKVAESGINTHDELAALKNNGYHAFLVGESLMRQPDIGAAVKKLLNAS